MQNILDKLVDSRIRNLLEIISINYPDKFKKNDIGKEIIYIKKNIKWEKQNNKKKIKLKQSPEPKKQKSQKSQKPVKIIEKEKQCQGRIWQDSILNKKTEIIVNSIETKFKVDNFNDIDLKDFNSKYIIGKRCSKNKLEKDKYCKLHSKHLIHGDYLENPNKELCYHFIKNGKYL
jgi:hypothetical protein